LQKANQLLNKNHRLFRVSFPAIAIWPAPLHRPAFCTQRWTPGDEQQGKQFSDRRGIGRQTEAAVT
jgi:hypothetical protein